MGNCLVTKLKGTVENSNLPRLGMLSFTIKNATAGWRSSFLMNSGTGIVSYSDGGYVTTGSGSDTKASDTKDIGTSSVNVYSSSGNYTLFFDDDYKASKIQISTLLNNNLFCDISQLKFRLNAKDIELLGNSSADNLGTLVGNIEELSVLTNLEILAIGGSFNITGDIAALKDLVLLTNLQFTNTKVEGSYEDLLSRMCINRNSGSMIFDCRRTDVTLHNVAVNTVRHNIVFSSTGCEVQPYGGGTAIATYTKSSGTWTYA